VAFKDRTRRKVAQKVEEYERWVDIGLETERGKNGKREKLELTH
jgi:hypothetical protein